MKGKSFHLFNEEKVPSLTNFDISTKNQNIRVVQEMGINSNYNINDNNIEYNPILKRNITSEINYI